jgi:hypothetical protein
MSRPYLYPYAAAFSRSHELSQAIARKEPNKAGFEIASTPTAWELFAFNADTIVVVTNVPSSSSKTYVHVLHPTQTRPPTSGSPKSWMRSRRVK